MENNALTPSPAPVPEPGTNMPEFAAAPAAEPQLVIPLASAMPDFGAEQQIANLTVNPTTSQATAPAEAPVEQSTEPAEPAEPDFIETIAPIIDMPVDNSNPLPLPVDPLGLEVPATEPVAEPVSVPVAELVVQPVEQSVEQPVAPAVEQTIQPETHTPGLGEITVESKTASEIAAEKALNSPAQTIEELVAESAQMQTPSTPVTPEKKKPNIKLFALIGAVVLLLGGGIATFMLLNQPAKPATNPTVAPVVNTGPDTSTPIAEITATDALEFLEATADYKTFFPDGYAEEEDMAMLDGSQIIALFYSYDKKENIIKTIKTSPVTVNYKDKLTSDNVTVQQEEVYAAVTIDPTQIKCKDICYGLIFNKKYLNYYNEPAIDLATGAQINVDHIILEKHEEKDIKKYAPLVAAVFMNGQKIYSTELSKFDEVLYLYVVNTIEYQPDSTRATQVKQTFFTINSQTGEMLYHPEMTGIRTLETQVEENELEEPNTNQ